jgi:AGZA family xanthine/uracil permease-like MFS transporter
MLLDSKKEVCYYSMADISRNQDGVHFESTLDTALNPNSARPPWMPQASNDDTPNSRQSDVLPRPSNLQSLIKRDFYKQDNWFEEMCDILFKLRRRKATVKAELYYGVIHFISCFYALAVVPQQLENAGYDARQTIVAVALCTGIGSIISGLFANLPFVLAPPTVVSIFLSVYLQQYNYGPKEGNIAVIISGFCLILFGWKPLGRFTARLIPISIQVGTAVGIGLLTALAGSTEINLVVSGTYTILKMGNITAEICIAFAGVIMVCIALRYHVKGSFCLAVLICSLIWWIYDDDFPTAVASVPSMELASFNHVKSKELPLLTVDLVFLYVLYLNGLMTSLSNLAVLTREDSTIPRGRWIYIICGGVTIASGLLCSAPILVSPESASSIKEGAKTGLSAVVAGVLFLIASLFNPIFEHVPAAGTSPILIMIGVILLQNVARIDWRNITNAAPAFVVLFYIPFTYSIIQGKLSSSFFFCCSLK